MTEHTYTDVNHALPHLCRAVLDSPVVPSRNGDTRELLYPQITLTDPVNREVLNSARKADLAAQVYETMWMLAGGSEIDVLSHYLPRARDYSDDGRTWSGAYGARLRDWHGRDQLWDTVSLLRADPSTRRAVMTLYDPARDNDGGLDVPCNNWLHFLIRNGRVHLHVATRSNDLIWGWSGINAFQWSALLELVAALTEHPVGALTFSVSSLHLYTDHFDRAERIAETLQQEGTDRVGASPGFAPYFTGTTTRDEFNEALERWLRLERKLRERPSAAPIAPSLLGGSNLLDTWAAVIGWRWSGDQEWLEFSSPRLRQAALSGVQHRAVLPPPADPEFLAYVDGLHREKGAVYGGSWCKRGEELSILPNVARKIDRLGTSGAGDTAADTAVDLLVYLAKYRVWLNRGSSDSPEHYDHVHQVLADLGASGRGVPGDPTTHLEDRLRERFETLCQRGVDRPETLRSMLPDAYALAQRVRRDERLATKTWSGYGE